MANKGYMTQQALQADRARLSGAETNLDRARREIEALGPYLKEGSEQHRKP
jgi:hypothetical protein